MDKRIDRVRCVRYDTTEFRGAVVSDAARAAYRFAGRRGRRSVTSEVRETRGERRYARKIRIVCVRYYNITYGGCGGGGDDKTRVGSRPRGEKLDRLHRKGARRRRAESGAFKYSSETGRVRIMTSTLLAAAGLARPRLSSVCF